MVESEREMIRSLIPAPVVEDRFTSLQPTYEDSVPPSSAQDWEFEQE